MKYIGIVFSFLLLSFNILASATEAGHGEAHISDLTFPVLNFSVLFGFLFFKFRKPLSNMFVKKSDSVKEYYAMADEKNKKAQIKLEMFKGKISELENDVQRIFSNTSVEVEKYLEKKQVDVKSDIEKIQSDVQIKLEVDKREMVRNVEVDLVETILLGAKSKIKADASLQNDINGKLISRLN